ncbi:MAG TPA: YjbE family putative metal transport protein [Stellaceae bacterium]|nr:YjbE family putative metal transport protein [Stellaceae bacterium]
MLPTVNQITALASVVLIDIVLAGDNAIVVGMAAAGLTPQRRRQAIVLGIAAATVLRIAFAAVALQLLEIIGLSLAGGILLLWVCWKFFREIRETQRGSGRGGAESAEAPVREKTAGKAVMQIVLADLSMSLDNVLAIAGVARTQAEPWVLFLGLILSVALMGLASTLIARLLARHFWLSWLGLAIITVVALRMIWAGGGEVLGHMRLIG